jgi:formyltetrahydrofolate synthetase
VLNAFTDDTNKEIEAVKKVAIRSGARFAKSRHWGLGGDGALEFADAVIDACKQKNNFKFLYPDTMPLGQRIEKIAKEIYGAKDVSYTGDAAAKLESLQKDPANAKLGTCMVKTHLSLTDIGGVVGAPKGWTLKVRNIMTFKGAGFLVPVAGDIRLMPGTASDAAFRRIKVNVKSGKVEGLF